MNPRFVFYRYPNADKQIFIESNHEDQFIYSTFEENKMKIIQGRILDYDPSFEYSPTAKNPVRPFVASFEQYKNAFLQYQKAFKEGHVEKAILSRIICQEMNDVYVHEIFNKLCEAYPNAFVYIAYLGDEGLWGGASPEKLVDFQDGIVSTVALAGTQTSDSPEVWGEKEKDEHRKVEEFIESLGEDNRFVLIQKSDVYLTKAGYVYHQKSDFTFIISEENLDDFIHVLHPTPAVCGTPKNESKTLISNTEWHTRDLYTGFLGLKPKKDQKFSLYVNLRCFQIQEKKLYIYVGGGLTKASDLQSEWEETIQKSKTIAHILG